MKVARKQRQGSKEGIPGVAWRRLQELLEKAVARWVLMGSRRMEGPLL